MFLGVVGLFAVLFFIFVFLTLSFLSYHRRMGCYFSLLLDSLVIPEGLASKSSQRACGTMTGNK